MKQMLAAQFETTGEAHSVVQVRTVDVPRPGVSEVLVEMQAAPIQPADLMFIAGRYRWTLRLSQTAGLEGTGVAVEANSEHIAVGRRVSFRHPGAWAQYAVVPGGACHLVPPDIHLDAAAQFAPNPVTAWALLRESCASTGGTVVLSAARSAIATLVARLAENGGIPHDQARATVG